MLQQPLVWIAAALAVVFVLRPVFFRIQLSLAKHPSLTGHPRLARALAAIAPAYVFTDDRFFSADSASPSVAKARKASFLELAERLRHQAPRTVRATTELAGSISDLQFTRAYRVPVAFSPVVREHLPTGAVFSESHGVRLVDLDSNELYDVAGSYGLNLFGHEFYKSSIAAGVAAVGNLGPILGAYHPVVAENVRRLREISGLDEISFHMSGTEAVMQAVRLARYHTRRSHLVRFAGAYHGWWDGVQPGLGNPRPPRDVYTLREMDERTLRVLRSRHDIACVLVNPIQALHPNCAPPSDGTLVSGDHEPRPDRQAYGAWLAELRRVCTDRGIVLILDEVFAGFRLALGGAQEYFGVHADMVTYGKSLGGGLPIGVLCGTRSLMRRFSDDHPTDICLARGTFSAHPYVMATMGNFLEHVSRPEVRAGYDRLDTLWNTRIQTLNDRLLAADVPVRVANLTSICCLYYTTASRYHWMLQYYLRAEGLALSWVGTGRLIFSHDYSDADFAAVADRIIRAATSMKAAGWWSGPPTTSRAIRRQMLREMLLAGVARPRARSGRLLRDDGVEHVAS